MIKRYPGDVEELMPVFAVLAGYVLGILVIWGSIILGGMSV